MNLTLTLTDSILIVESHEKSGNNISLIFEEAVTITLSLPEVYKIVRSADTAFARTAYP